MNSELLKKAHEKIPSVPVLVNLVSRRERELVNGAKPLIRPSSLDVDKCDIALQEVAEGKLIAEIDFDAIAKAEAAKTKWNTNYASVVSLAGSYAAVLKGELWLVGADISAYEFGNRFNHDPKRDRKLLVHAKEVRDLKMKSEAKGLTLVPLKIFLKRGRVKVELGVCRGKALHDKREALKKKALQRDADR